MRFASGIHFVSTPISSSRISAISHGLSDEPAKRWRDSNEEIVPITRGTSPIVNLPNLAVRILRRGDYRTAAEELKAIVAGVLPKWLHAGVTRNCNRCRSDGACHPRLDGSYKHGAAPQLGNPVNA